MENRIFSHLFGDFARDCGRRVMLWQAGIVLATLRRRRAARAARAVADSVSRQLRPRTASISNWASGSRMR
jgi:hypothetical protein